jgi:ribosomal protein L18E
MRSPLSTKESSTNSAPLTRSISHKLDKESISYLFVENKKIADTPEPNKAAQNPFLPLEGDA